MAFLTANRFFKVRFQKYWPKGYLCVYFFKAESKSKHEEKFFWGGFSLKTKNALFLGVQNGSYWNSTFKFVFLRLFFNVKGIFVPIFTKNINIYYLGPLEYFENENFAAGAPKI